MKLKFYRQTAELLGHPFYAGVFIQIEDESGEYLGEFGFRWLQTNMPEQAVCFQVYDDTWEAFRQFFDEVMPAIMALPEKTPDAIAQALSDWGATDITHEVLPDAK